MMCSWNGLKSKSRTEPLCPPMTGRPASMRPGLECSTMANGPPPPWSATAKNFVLPLMYCCSPVAVESRNPCERRNEAEAAARFSRGAGQRAPPARAQSARVEIRWPTDLEGLIDLGRLHVHVAICARATKNARPDTPALISGPGIRPGDPGWGAPRALVRLWAADPSCASQRASRARSPERSDARTFRRPHEVRHREAYTRERARICAAG